MEGKGAIEDEARDEMNRMDGMDGWDGMNGMGQKDISSPAHPFFTPLFHARPVPILHLHTVLYLQYCTASTRARNPA